MGGMGSLVCEFARMAGNGGERGIRTLDTLFTYTHFPGVRLQPLGHLSGLGQFQLPAGASRWLNPGSQRGRSITITKINSPPFPVRWNAYIGNYLLPFQRTLESSTTCAACRSTSSPDKGD